GISGISSALKGIATAAAAVPAWLAGPLAGLITLLYSRPAGKGEADYMKAHPEKYPHAGGAGITLFDLMQKLENSGPGETSKKGAIGRNQIMPGTAKQYGFDPSRLGEPAYNDMVARAIEADLSRRYGGNLD